MSANQKSGGGDRDSDGVRAELLAQKALYESESHAWRHPLTRLAAIVGTTLGGWRRKLWRH
jgi:hypothetical protein